MAITGGHFDSWLLYELGLKLGLTSALDPAKFRLILHNSTLIGAASTKAEVIAAEIPAENNYSRYVYSILLSELVLDAANHLAEAPVREWTISAVGGTWQFSGAVMLGNASDQANTICTATLGTNRINVTGHGLADGDEVLFTSVGSVFGGLTAATIYYVVNSTTDDFQVEATVGGGVVSLTDNGSSDVVLHYANGELVSGFTYDTPQTLFDGSSDKVRWNKPSVLNYRNSAGNSWV